MAAGGSVPLLFDSALVSLSYAIAVLGALGVSMAAARIRRVGGVGLRTGYIALAAFAQGGVGRASRYGLSQVRRFRRCAV